jgi:hypothetical protein
MMCGFGVFLDHSREALRQHPQHSRQQAKARVGQELRYCIRRLMRAPLRCTEKNKVLKSSRCTVALAAQGGFRATSVSSGRSEGGIDRGQSHLQPHPVDGLHKSYHSVRSWRTR